MEDSMSAKGGERARIKEAFVGKHLLRANFLRKRFRLLQSLGLGFEEEKAFMVTGRQNSCLNVERTNGRIANNDRNKYWSVPPIQHHEPCCSMLVLGR